MSGSLRFSCAFLRVRDLGSGTVGGCGTSAAVKGEAGACAKRFQHVPRSPEMEDILVATAARPQDAHFDERLEGRQHQWRQWLRSRAHGSFFSNLGGLCMGHKRGGEGGLKRFAPSGCSRPPPAGGMRVTK